MIIANFPFRISALVNIMSTEDAKSRKAANKNGPDCTLPGFNPIKSKAKLTTKRMMGKRYLDRNNLMFIVIYFRTAVKVKNIFNLQSAPRIFLSSSVHHVGPAFVLLGRNQTLIMFTEGRIYFTLFFIAAFAVVLIIAYRKDLPIQKKHYGGVLILLVAVLLFLALFIFTKRLLLGV